jgi:hypothetical protein
LKYFPFLILLLCYCKQSPLFNGNKQENLIAEYSFVNQITKNSAVVNWKCNNPTEKGLVLYGIGNFNQSQFTFLKSEYQTAALLNLNSGNPYQYQVFCSDVVINQRNFLLNQVFPQTFTTLSLDAQTNTTSGAATGVSTNADTNLNSISRFIPKSIPRSIQISRGIWILGGIGSNSLPVSQVDLFDPVNLSFIPAITNVPTPRAYAQIVSHKSKIYVIGGMTFSAGYVASSLVEEYDPTTGVWTTKANMPSPLQGGVIGSVGEEIVLVAGSTTSDMTTGTITNTVYKFRPDTGVNGTWSVFSTANIILNNNNMGGCVIQGNLFYTGGRQTTNGSPVSTTDAYVTASNSTTQNNEALISVGREGLATACYRPSATDTNPLDTAGILVVGGNTVTNVFQPPTAITATNKYEFMQIGNGTNAFTTGPNLPATVYYPAIEVSYENRTAYVFGGATAINLPTNIIYSIGLSNPTAGPWTTETVTMPVARFGHKAVIINR